MVDIRDLGGYSEEQVVVLCQDMKAERDRQGDEESRRKLEALGQVAVGLLMPTDCGGCQS